MRLSIITINYNNANGLQQTIESVKNQTFRDFEHLIIDGGSTDTSVDIIKKFEDGIVYWVSEKDNGIYNAQNKGIEQSKGEYLIFLNSGDFLSDKDVLKDLSVCCTTTDIVFGDIKFKTESTEHTQRYPDLINFSFFLSDSLPHPCTAIKKSLFVKHGFYDEAMAICSDWAFFIDMICKYNASYKHIHRVISTFLTGGLSTDVAVVNLEKNSYLEKNYSAVYSQHLELLRIRGKYEHFKNTKFYRFTRKLFPSVYKDFE